MGFGLWLDCEGISKATPGVYGNVKWIQFSSHCLLQLCVYLVKYFLGVILILLGMCMLFQLNEICEGQEAWKGWELLLEEPWVEIC